GSDTFWPLPSPGSSQHPEILIINARDRLTRSAQDPVRILVTGRVVHLLEHVATAREQARRETWLLLAPQVNKPARRAELDALLVVDASLGRIPLAWLGAGPTSSSPTATKTELAKLAYLRGLDAHTLGCR
ncbi:MAG: hypothetical protein WCF33_01085, partial [Pseudonocardiaceae bacterium]